MSTRYQAQASSSSRSKETVSICPFPLSNWGHFTWWTQSSSTSDSMKILCFCFSHWGTPLRVQAVFHLAHTAHTQLPGTHSHCSLCHSQLKQGGWFFKSWAQENSWTNRRYAHDEGCPKALIPPTAGSLGPYLRISSKLTWLEQTPEWYAYWFLLNLFQYLIVETAKIIFYCSKSLAVCSTRLDNQCVRVAESWEFGHLLTVASWAQAPKGWVARNVRTALEAVSLVQ